MLNIAVVEDDEGYRSQITGFIDRFWTERGMEVKVIQFPDGGEILKDYRPGFDIILLDIEMPQVDGMSAAKVRGTMQSAEKELEERHFVRCNYWYLVNLCHVSEVTLPLSAITAMAENHRSKLDIVVYVVIAQLKIMLQLSIVLGVLLIQVLALNIIMVKFPEMS